MVEGFSLLLDHTVWVTTENRRLYFHIITVTIVLTNTKFTVRDRSHRTSHVHLFVQTWNRLTRFTLQSELNRDFPY